MNKINYPSITKFQELVELKDYRKPTKKEYVRYVRKLAEHFQCDPATLTEDQIRQYFIFLREHKQYSRSPMKMAKYALMCFYVECLKVSGWTAFEELRVAQPLVLPVVLSRQEVKHVLAAVREPNGEVVAQNVEECLLDRRDDRVAPLDLERPVDMRERLVDPIERIAGGIAEFARSA